MSAEPFKVGITGGIGSGKSLVCKVFMCLGVPVYDADSRTRTLMQTDQALIANLKSAFGEEIYVGKELQRTLLAKIVFADPSKLAILNALVHPSVELDFVRWARLQSSPYVLKEAALLVEAGSYKQLDCLLLVTAPEHVRKQRVRLRDPQRSDTDIDNVMARQLSDEAKRPFAQHILVNDGHSAILPHVLQLHQLFCEKRCS